MFSYKTLGPASNDYIEDQADYNESWADQVEAELSKAADAARRPSEGSSIQEQAPAEAGLETGMADKEKTGKDSARAAVSVKKEKVSYAKFECLELQSVAV